jgi:membrane fusion protein (multidrug efflux system)
MLKFKLISTFIALCFVSGIYFIFSATPVVAPIPKVVEVITAESQSIEQKVRLIGIVRAKHATILTAKASGVLEILKQSDESVTKGTLIARINNPDLEKRYELALSIAQIAKEQYDRTLILMKTGARSKLSTEEKQSAYLEAERNLATAKIELSRVRFYAPFDGVIGVYKERDGTEIKNEAALVSFYDPTALTVQFNVPAPILSAINVGQKVMIDGKHYRLTHIQKILDESTHMAPATVDIVSEGHIVGVSVDVELTVHEKNNVIVLPDEAVFLEQGEPHVYVIKESKTVLTPVELGLRARDRVEITKGLKSGDVVVSQAQSRLSKGTEVKIHDPKAATIVKGVEASSKK